MNARELLNNWLAGKGYKIERTMPVILREDVRFAVDLDFLIEHEIYRRSGDFYFVQIGANDGVSRPDDLIRYVRGFGASGILVEPQPDLFEQLQRNFAEFPHVQLVNKAIHRTESSMMLYRIEPGKLDGIADLPLWARTNGIASFDRAHVIEHVRRIGLSENVVESAEVPCVSLDGLLEESPRIPDLLKVDTEGYDYEVLSMLDLSRFKPTIMRFEHLHMSQEQYESLVYRLIAAGYRFLADKMNTTAYLPQPAF